MTNYHVCGLVIENQETDVLIKKGFPQTPMSAS
jgi:hypothetical protein